MLSHTKKGHFWRELIGLYPQFIDYLCNPNVDAVKPPYSSCDYLVIDHSPVFVDLMAFAGTSTNRS